MFQSYFQKVTELLALEYNCAPEDFRRQENVLTVSVLREGRRIYSLEPYFFHMVTAGSNTVITADESMHPFLRELMKAPDAQGHWLMSVPNFVRIEQELNRHGYTLTQTHHMFLPASDQTPEGNWPVRRFYDAEIMPFYGDPRFPNAICPEYLAGRPDRIVICAYDEAGEIAGMTGCSEDAPHWQQIGIDVLPAYRSRGLGSYLVTMLKNEILGRGDIPFYGTVLSNYHSQQIALHAGFRPAWVEIGAEKIREEKGEVCDV